MEYLLCVWFFLCIISLESQKYSDVGYLLR